MSATAWFEVDSKGLRNLMKGREKAFILYELVQNAWDQRVTEVQVQIKREGRFTFIQVIDDDPEGFADISHAYTLFAPSAKVDNPEQRGRFNLGEKMVLALATSAMVKTTKGTVMFNAEGRHETRSKRDAGSEVMVQVLMTKDEHSELIDAAQRLIAPVKTTVNGYQLPLRKPVASFECSLPTVVGDAEGVLKATTRVTKVEVYETKHNEVAWLYELGIPVVQTFDRFHVNVGQKVPLNMDRDNVTPAYLRKVRTAVLGVTAELLTPDQTTETWVKEACKDSNVDPTAVKVVMETRFGANAVAYDPSDPEANKLSTAGGRQVIHGGTLSAAEWANVRKAGALRPAGQVTPSPKPYSPDGEPLRLIEQKDWTDGMNALNDFLHVVSNELLGHGIHVQMANDAQWPFAATYGPTGTLVFNVGRLGRKWFENGITEAVLDLIIHEFGHEYESDHLSERYYNALSRLGAKMTLLAVQHPEIFLRK